MDCFEQNEEKRKEIFSEIERFFRLDQYQYANWKNDKEFTVGVQGGISKSDVFDMENSLGWSVGDVRPFNNNFVEVEFYKL